MGRLHDYLLGAPDEPDSRRISALARDCGAHTHVVSSVCDILPSMLAGASAIGLAESTSASPGLAAQVTDALWAEAKSYDLTWWPTRAAAEAARRAARG